MGLSTLTHTPTPMAFLSRVLDRPENERPFVLFPIGWAFVSSLKTRGEIFDLELAWIPKHPTLENYVSILQTPEYIRYFANTLLVTIVASLLTVVLALTAGYDTDLRYRGFSPPSGKNRFLQTGFFFVSHINL